MNLTSHPLLNFLKVMFGITLFALHYSQATPEPQKFTFPCEVAAGRWNKLRESGHG